MQQLPWCLATRKLADRIFNGHSVAVHVRRTDYVGNSDVAVCGADYFKRAMELLREHHEGLEFHLFSDDPKWCAQQFSNDGVSVQALPEAAGDPLHDLFLMSCARHHIICNSTYSWWSAWLAKNPDQKVIMPDRWFVSGIVAPIDEKQADGWQTLCAEPPGC